LLAEDASNLNLKEYQKRRFDFAVFIAQQWFTILEKLSSDQLKELKQDLSGKTLVGEYVGNPELQHMIEYSRQTIIFYAVVDNNCSKICLPPEESLALFKKYGLDSVSFQSCGVFNDFAKLCECLLQTHELVAKSKISEFEEGGVLYLV